MKIHIQILLAILSFFTLVNTACSQDTNNIYLPEENGQSLYQAEGANSELNKHAREAAIRAGECRPAELDPDGHWGALIGGLQLSIRANTNCFVAGSPILVAVIIRNTTTNTLSRFNADDGGESIFTIEDESGQKVKRFATPGYSNVNFVKIDAKRQVKHEYDLNSQFHLETGIYRIQVSQGAIIQMPGPRQVGTNICSGILTIKVVSP
jgi:hypothetical protein